MGQQARHIRTLMRPKTWAPLNLVTHLTEGYSHMVAICRRGTVTQMPDNRSKEGFSGASVVALLDGSKLVLLVTNSRGVCRRVH